MEEKQENSFFNDFQIKQHKKINKTNISTHISKDIYNDLIKLAESKQMTEGELIYNIMHSYADFIRKDNK